MGEVSRNGEVSWIAGGSASCSSDEVSHSVSGDTRNDVSHDTGEDTHHPIKQSRDSKNKTTHIPVKEYLEVEDQLWEALDQLIKRLPKGRPSRLPSKYERDSIGFLGFSGLFDGRIWA